MAVTLTLASCKEGKPSAPAAEATSIRVDRYVVRGQVAMLPDPANPSAEFQVRHEAIPQFVGPEGKLGMDTMTMPFPLADGLSLESVKVGDKIELTFDVDYDTTQRSPVAYRATEVKALPAETTLDFSSIRH